MVWSILMLLGPLASGPEYVAVMVKPVSLTLSAEAQTHPSEARSPPRTALVTAIRPMEEVAEAFDLSESGTHI